MLFIDRLETFRSSGIPAGRCARPRGELCGRTQSVHSSLSGLTMTRMDLMPTGYEGRSLDAIRRLAFIELIVEFVSDSFQRFSRALG